MVKFSVRKPLTVFVAVLAILILGVVAFTRMTPDLLPNMDFPYVVIVTTYPGASPETVEAEVTKPMEQAMATLEHIESVTSVSNENYSMLMLEFQDSVNMDTVGVDIQQELTSLSGTWDSAVGTPYMIKINPSLLPVEVAAVSMDGLDAVELSDFVDNTLLPQLEGVSGVARISTIGSITRRVHVVIDEAMIDAVNARLREAVDHKLDDAEAELAETRAELEEAQQALEEAQQQLSSGKAELIDQTGSAETAINEQQVALLQGRMEIQTRLVALAQSRSQLETTLSIVRPIAEKLHALAERQQAAETRRDALREAGERLLAADEALAALTIAEWFDPGKTTDEPESGEPDEDAPIPEPEQSEEYQAALEEVRAAEQALIDLDSGRYTYLADILSTEAELALIDTELAAIDAALGAMDLSRDGIDDTVAEMDAGIAQIDEATTLLNATLAQLDAGSIQLSEALGTLSTAKSEGILQLADAAAQISSNAATVDSALAQIDSGLDSLADSREDALASADISETIGISTVTSILTAQNFAMPAGTVTEDGITYMVSVGDEMTDPDELRGLVLFDTGEDAIGPVYLSDVAQIFVTDDSESSYARLNGENGLILSFEKQSSAATAEVTDNLAERFSRLEEKYDGLHFVSLMDQGSYIYLIIRTILESLVFGAIFAVIVLVLFLRDIRPTFITLVSIPVSVVFAFVLMYFTGVTLNMISLSGLAVSVGMLVDNSIVVIENIYRLRRMGATPVQAAVQGAKQVAGAITASTLTTVCVFLPIVFVEGITKKLFTDLALTMGYSLMASLFIALTLVPAMARGMLRDTDHRKSKKAPAGENAFYRGYRRFIGWSLRRKWLVLPLALVLLIASTGLALSRGFSYMPDIDMNTVDVTITMPEGATREEAVALADEVLERISGIENVETVGAMMGGTSLLSTSDSYNVTAYVTLPEGDSGAAAGAQIAALCEDLPVEISCDSQMMNMSYLTGSGVGIYVFGNDMDSLQRAARQIAEALEAVPGLANASDGLEDAEPALHIAVDRNAAMEKGYTVAQVYMQIAAALTESASSISMDMGDVTADVLVSTDTGLTPDELMALSLDYTNSDGETESFPLSDIAELEETVSLSSIRRIDQRRYVSVTADTEEGANVTLVTAKAQAAVAALELPDGVSYEFDGESEAIMEAVEQLVLMLLLGVVLVYFIMVAQFQSLKSPFVVMFTIPLAFTGGFLGLLICGLDVSILSLIGFVMLTGVIVNNGIVLVDCVNQLRAEGMERREALIEAGVTRLRPILMTSLTTVLGLIVMALGQSPGTAMMQPVAIVCIGGLLYATLMTLIVVPCIYDMMNKKDVTVVRDEEMVFDEA